MSPGGGREGLYGEVAGELDSKVDGGLGGELNGDRDGGSPRPHGLARLLLLGCMAIFESKQDAPAVIHRVAVLGAHKSIMRDTTDRPTTRLRRTWSHHFNDYTQTMHISSVSR